MGKNSIGGLLSEASKFLPKSTSNCQKVANHSSRKTCITNLLNNNVNEIHVGQLSGHKKIDSLQSYNVASMQQQKKMSDIIGDKRKSENDQLCIPNSIQNQLLSEWNMPFPPSASVSIPTFYGATMNNCTFNINVYNSSPPSKLQKRRRIFIEEE